MKEQHVLPIGDMWEHECSPDCWCVPVEDTEVEGMWIHNAADGRQDYESGKRKPH
jgi:hypothetical protein